MQLLCWARALRVVDLCETGLGQSETFLGAGWLGPYPILTCPYLSLTCPYLS